MNTEESVSVTSIDRLRIFCADCERRAEILWHMTANGMVSLVHARCHDEERLISLPTFFVRVLEHTRRGEFIDALWSQLCDVGTDERLQQMAEQADRDAIDQAQLMIVIDRVLKSRNNRVGRTP